MSDKAVIIVAGGVGLRAGGDRPKQFMPVDGIPMICHTIRSFHQYDNEIKIIVVMHKDFTAEFADMAMQYLSGIKMEICSGGDSRCDSVYNGLKTLEVNLLDLERCRVGVHDAARPLIMPDVIERAYSGVSRGVGVVPVVKCVNSLRRLLSNGDTSLCETASESVVRKDYVEVQTPQVFYADELLQSYANIAKEKGFREFTDDASVAEACGMSISLCEGSAENIKVTHPVDFEIASLIIRHRLAK